MKKIKHGEYWSNVKWLLSKPSKFKVIDGKDKIYSCLISVDIIPDEKNIPIPNRIYTNAHDQSKMTKQITEINFQYHVKNHKIDENKLKTDIKNFFNGLKVCYEIEQFKRDGGAFPFIRKFYFLNEKEGSEWLFNFNRVQKLNKILAEIDE